MALKMTQKEIVDCFGNALKSNEFFILYQPQINHSNGTMIGAEAFVRWKHGEYGVQPASDFIHILEECNLTAQLDLYVMEQVCRFQRKCLDEHQMAVPTAVNISASDLYAADFIDKVEAVRRKYDIPVQYLRIEMGVCATKKELELAKEALEKFHEKKYIVLLDKFGSENSSFNNIRELKADAIKLDLKQFGRAMDERAGIIIGSALKMAKWLKTPVIAQCVETVRQADFLKSVGCSYIQGYLYSKPLTEDEFVNKMITLRYEPVIASMHLLEETDLYRYINPDSAESLLFDNFIGGAAIIACGQGKLEILRVNKRYMDEIGMNTAETEMMASNLWDTFDEDNKKIYENAIQKAIETQEDQVCDTWRAVYSKCCGDDNICIRSELHLMGHAGQQYVFFESIHNITTEKRHINEVEENETKFRFAADQINVFAWEYDVATREMRPCSRCRRELGLPPILKNYPEPVIESGLFPPDYADMYREWHKKIAQGVDHLEAVIPLTPDRIPFYVRYTTEFNEAGIPVKAYASAALVVEDEEKKTAISEKKKAQAALEKALIEAERANAAKTAFLSKMSHDIRTPLNGIIGLLEMDERHPGDWNMIEGNRGKMKIAADHLLSLINDILELSKMESDNVVLAHEAFDIGKLTEDVLVIAGMRAGESGITLTRTDFGGRIKFPYVYGSPLHVRQIILNILSNSIKYNVSGGSITFDMDVAACNENKVVYKYTITDTGIGMDEKFLAHIFEPFTQEQHDARSVYQGTGLGMPIVKSLLDKMYGDIDVQSKKGAGSTFTITIPFDIAASDDNKDGDEAEADITGAKILLVEDNELNMEIAELLLEDAGASVAKAVNGQQALDLFAQNPPGTFDVILMDVMMPVLDGLSAARAIRALPREDAKSIPIIAMTANAFAEDKIEAKKAGMNDHIAKPFNGDDMIKKIGRYLTYT